MIHVVFFCSEAVPFAKTGGMADVCGALPLALEKLGARVTVFMPLYSAIDQKKHRIHKSQPSFAQTTVGKSVQVYLVEHHQFYHRDGLYGTSYGDYRDNLERFGFFCSRGLEILRENDMKADIIHCHDWQTALVPVYLKTRHAHDRFYSDMSSVLTIHNLAFQGVFPREQFGFTGLEGKYFNSQGFEFYGQINLLKAGIFYSDYLTTVSPQYAREIQTQEFGWGLEGVLRSRKENLWGILNGIDDTFWDPQNDPLIEAPYSEENLTGKVRAKAGLQQACGFDTDAEVPVLSFIGRLAQQKGIDIMVPALEGILSRHQAQVVILGVGEERYHRMFGQLSKHFPRNVSVHLGFDEGLAHKIYAGSDIFLMPSNYEPCGLSQMISLRYGTIPVVYHTGGLADTVTSFEHQGNGFVFNQYNTLALSEAIRQAIQVFHNKALFHSLVKRALKSNFSWEISAGHYLDLYQRNLKTKT